MLPSFSRRCEARADIRLSSVRSNPIDYPHFLTNHPLKRPTPRKYSARRLLRITVYSYSIISGPLVRRRFPCPTPTLGIATISASHNGLQRCGSMLPGCT
ncbi:hypothetical protein CKA45_20300, partial [Pseudomonas aeruginosa]